jgi:hypothetical protein
LKTWDGRRVRRFYAALAEKYAIKLIQVYADLETCLERVKS